MTRPVHIDAERLLRRLRATAGEQTKLESRFPQDSKAAMMFRANRRGLRVAIDIVREEMERAGQESES